MSASSPYSSTYETTNANRACRLLLGPCTDELRDVLRHHVPPPSLTQILKMNKQSLPRLTAAQKGLNSHGHGNYTGNYNDMDITQLYTLLRNICNIPPHSNGWGNDPDPNDRSLSANIDRIRSARNQCVHSSSPSLSNADFTSIWSTIRSAVVDMDTFLNNGKKYEKEVDFLRHETMDPAGEKYYREQLRKQVEEDHQKEKENSKRIDELIKRPNSLSFLSEKYNMEIKNWKCADNLYHETHSFPSMMEKVRRQPYITFVGSPGSGKSATARHIALKLQEEGYEVLPIKDISKIEEYCDSRHPQVFVIDDVLGVFGLDERKLPLLRNYEQTITKPCMDKSKILMTCRQAVYNEALPYKSYLIKDESVIKLHSSENALDDNDKKLILEMYGLDSESLSPSLTSAYHMFPLLCKLFSKEARFQKLGSSFFTKPVESIINELNEMQANNKLHYAALVLCMLNEKLSENILEHQKTDIFNEMKNCVLENLNLLTATDTFKLVDALSAMEGTYTKQSGTEFTFIHDSMYEICAYHYGKQFPDQVLLYLKSDYVANYVKPQKCEKENVKKREEKENIFHSNENNETSDGNNVECISESFDLCIRLSEDRYRLLAERLYRDIEKMELYDVFMNDALKHPQVCQAFIDVLKEKKYEDLRSLFLHRQKNVHNVMGKNRFDLKEVSGKDEKFMYIEIDLFIHKMFLYDLLADERLVNGHLICNVRVISWVIYYGHHKILQFITEQTQQHRETQSKVFHNGIMRTIKSSFQRGSSSLFKLFNGEERWREEARLLLLGCHSGDLETVKTLLQYVSREETITTQHPDFMNTPLTAACKAGCASVVEELLNFKSDVNQQDQEKKTPLIVACEGGHASIVEKLLEVGVLVNKPYDTDTPLMAACKGGHASIVEKLLEAGASVNTSCFSDAPLLAACREGHVSIVEKLVKVGADVNIRGSEGDTPLIAACKRGDASIVEKLLKGRTINFRNIQSNFFPDLNILYYYEARCTKLDDGLLITLFVALIHNKHDVVKLLIRKENSRSENKGNLYLFYILLMLRHADVRMDLRDDVVIGEGRVWTLNELGYLWEIIYKGDCDVLSHLLRIGMQVNHLLLVNGVWTSGVRSLLCLLINKGFVLNREEKIQILLEAGADVNVSMLEEVQKPRYILPVNRMMIDKIKKHIRRHSV
ncbi:uncharacterized protein LOC133205130 [Saccostrea echinata]|uniref:uncharacterized protein LOC133205130 n=1 Tax=Saccostrea echinata TaxID=191078 RepID=UPI002A823C8B|nr:uncharacterized protein LOC133205130 [Saccostrea echinata]